MQKLLIPHQTIWMLLIGGICTGLGMKPQSTLCPGMPLPTGSGPIHVAARDVDGDSQLDLIVPNFLSDTVSIMLGNGDGTFAPQADFQTGPGSHPAYVSIADLDGDAKLDLVLTDFNTAQVSVLLGNGDGTFLPEANYNTGSWPHSVEVGDLNEDGFLDLVVAVNSEPIVSILIGNGDGTFGASTSISTGTSPYGPVAVALADYNGDMNLDIASANYYSSDLSILLGNGDGTFAPATTIDAGHVPRSIVAVDLDGDLSLDLVVPNEYNAGDVGIFLGDGLGGFGPMTTYLCGTGPTAVAVGDIDGDTELDLVVANIQSHDVSLLLGNGNGTFCTSTPILAGARPRSVTMADLDGSGTLDVIVATEDADGVAMLVNSCSGRLFSITPFCFGDGTSIRCPCGNTGQGSRGCENSSTTGGALLVGSGEASLSADTLLLTASNERPTAFSLFWQGGSEVTPRVFGDGVGCMGSPLKRMYRHNAIGGTVIAPVGGDLSVSARSAALGDPINRGTIRVYHVFYRDPDPSFCPSPFGSTFNTTNGLRVLWGG